MSSNKNKTDYDVMGMVKRAYKFWQEDHLLGTFLGAFVAIFAKWYLRGDGDVLDAMWKVGQVLVALTFITYFFKYFAKKQEIEEIKAKVAANIEMLEKKFQHDTLHSLASAGTDMLDSLMLSLLELWRDPGEELVSQYKSILQAYYRAIVSARKNLVEYNKTIELPHKEFVLEFFAEEPEPSTLEGLPKPEGEKMALAKMLDDNDDTKLNNLDPPDMNPTSEELEEKTAKLLDS